MSAEELQNQKLLLQYYKQQQENREKYKDEAGLKKQRIEAARAIGVAFGNGQQPVTTNITWLH